MQKELSKNKKEYYSPACLLNITKNNNYVYVSKNTNICDFAGFLEENNKEQVFEFLFSKREEISFKTTQKDKIIELDSFLKRKKDLTVYLGFFVAKGTTLSDNLSIFTPLFYYPISIQKENESIIIKKTGKIVLNSTFLYALGKKSAAKSIEKAIYNCSSRYTFNCFYKLLSKYFNEIKTINLTKIEHYSTEINENENEISFSNNILLIETEPQNQEYFDYCKIWNKISFYPYFSTKKKHFEILPCDYTQFSTLSDILNNKNTVITGAPGTGKTQTIINIIANAIGNGKKVLVMSKKQAVLDKIYSQLDLLQKLTIHISSDYTDSLEEKVKRQFSEKYIRKTQRKANKNKYDFSILEEYLSFLQEKICDTVTVQDYYNSSITHSILFCDSLLSKYHSLHHFLSIPYNNIEEICRYSSFDSIFDTFILLNNNELFHDCSTIFSTQIFGYNTDEILTQIKQTNFDTLNILSDEITKKMENSFLRKSSHNRFRNDISEVNNFFTEQIPLLRYFFSKNGYNIFIKKCTLHPEKTIKETIFLLENVEKVKTIQSFISRFPNIGIFILELSTQLFNDGIIESQNFSEKIIEIYLNLKYFLFLQNNKNIPEIPSLEKIAEEFKEKNNKYYQSNLPIVLYRHAYKNAKKYKNLEKNQLIPNFFVKKREMFHKDFWALLRYFPCVLITTDLVSSTIPLKKNIFDLVIFEEGGQLSIQESLSGMYRAKQKIILGDEKQINFNIFRFKKSDKEYVPSLIDYTKTKFKHNNLDYCYRSAGKDLMNFSNIFFYNNKIITAPSPALHSTVEIVYTPNGIWNNQKNEIEGDKAVEIITDISSKNEYKKKTIGVITFNYEQKKLIERKLKKLNANHNISIHNIDNIQGEEKDIIIVSVAYGTNSKGKVVNNLGYLSKKEGAKYFNVAITRAKEKLFFITSLKSNQIKTTKENNGVYYLKKYLEGKKYNKAIKKETNQQNNIIREISQYLTSRKLSYINNYTIGPIRLPIAIYINNTLSVAIDTEFNSENIKEEIEKRLFLQKNGFIILQIWAQEWCFSRAGCIKKIEETISNRYHLSAKSPLCPNENISEENVENKSFS